MDDTDDRSFPPLDPKDVERYENLKAYVRLLRKTHGNMPDRYAVERAEYKAQNCNFIPSEFEAHRLRKCRETTEKLKEMEKSYLEARDKVLRAGGEPLGPTAHSSTADSIVTDLHDPQEFGDTHPEDGKVGCMSEATLQYLAQRTERARPDFERWLAKLEDGIAPSDGYSASQAGTGRDSNLEGVNEGAFPKLTPWDSLSS